MLELEKLIDGSLSNDEFQNELAKYLCVSKSTIYNWIGDKFRSLTNKRDLLIYKLHMLGWTQQEIAYAIVKAGYEKDYSDESVRLRKQEFVKLQKLVFSQFGDGKPIKDIVKENEKYYAGNC